MLSNIQYQLDTLCQQQLLLLTRIQDINYQSLEDSHTEQVNQLLIIDTYIVTHESDRKPCKLRSIFNRNLEQFESVEKEGKFGAISPRKCGPHAYLKVC